MTEINYWESKYRLKSKGHAGYAGKGQDVVCAALTALTAGVAHGLEADGIPCIVLVNEEDETVLDVQGKPRAGQEEDCRKILNAFAAAIEAVAEVYPYNAHITIHRQGEED